MFTGLVLGMGKIVRLQPGAGETRITVAPLFPVAGAWVKGESIAVNGACLSVETFDDKSFTAYASQETLRLTNLKHLKPGQTVNLERALAFGDRLGGHLVSGHVDAVAVVESVGPAGTSRRVQVRFPKEFSPQVISKGSVALDGVSLTVNACSEGRLEVNVIPETLGATTVGTWEAGREINFETDLIGKYVQRMLAPHTGTGEEDAPKGGLTFEFLRENGF